MKSIKTAISALIAAILLLSVVFTLAGCSSDPDGQTGTMKAEDLFDREMTHKPTEEEINALRERIRDGELKYAEVVEAIGRPHGSGPTGVFSGTWETTTGKTYCIMFTPSEDAPPYGTADYFWIHSHYGMAYYIFRLLGAPLPAVMAKEEFFDPERTHKPTDEEVQAIKARINEQWALVRQRWEELGSPAIENFVDFADEQCLDLIIFSDVVDAIGRPHCQNPETGMGCFQWETTSGAVWDFTFSVQKSGEPLGESEEQDYWIYAYWGIAQYEKEA